MTNKFLCGIQFLVIVRARTEKHKSNFYHPHYLSEWNKLDPEIRLSVAVFKRRILSIIGPSTKSVFGIHDPKGLSHLTQLRVGLSKLNFHKFQHNFRDTINPMCPSNDGIEDTEHFLLLCPSFGVQRTDLLAGIYTLVRPYGMDMQILQFCCKFNCTAKRIFQTISIEAFLS